MSAVTATRRTRGGRARAARSAGVLLTLATVAVGCSSPAPTAQADDAGPTKTTLRIIGGSSAFVPLWIADEQGFLRDQGLTMAFEQILQGSTITEAVSSNQADAATSTWVTTISAAAAAPGPKIVMSTSEGVPVSLVLRSEVAASRGITATGPFSDLSRLRGSHLRVATSDIGGALYTWATAIARDAGLTAGPEPDNDLVLVPAGVGPPQVALWNRDDVDALFLPDEFLASSGLSDIVSLPLGRTAPTFAGAGGTALIVSEELARDHPGSVRAFTNAAYRGIRWAVDPANKAAVVQLFQSRLSMPAAGAESFYDVYVASAAKDGDICPSSAGFERALSIANLGRPTPISVAEADVVDRTFCEAAAGGS